jgi:DNA repair ATPase RecN|tara:strand:+ start:1023 stop:1322 length:300 start_codon:yes stop_codon:yes gene_type:complete
MKVKIAYTVDYEQVPEMMEDLLSSIRDELSASLQKLKFRPNDLSRMSEDFEHLINKLNLVESQIQDVLQIATGWSQALEKFNQQDQDSIVEEVQNEEAN